uniref:Uncharacterized protein n=1 Tax=Romanomermis culicivorax TaxID=13658 RepID=A0A915K082_ROMCU
MKEARSSDWQKKIDGNKTSRDIKGVATGAVFKEKQSMIPSEFRFCDSSAYLQACFIKGDVRKHLKQVYYLQAFCCCINEQEIIERRVLSCYYQPWNVAKQ